MNNIYFLYVNNSNLNYNINYIFKNYSRNLERMHNF